MYRIKCQCNGNSLFSQSIIENFAVHPNDNHDIYLIICRKGLIRIGCFFANIETSGGSRRS